MEKFVTNKNKRLKGPEKIKTGSNTSAWTAPDTAAVPQDDDKIIYYLKSEFDRTMPYYNPNISSTNRKKT